MGMKEQKGEKVSGILTVKAPALMSDKSSRLDGAGSREP